MERITIRPDDELYNWIQLMAEREDQKIPEMVLILLDRIRLAISVENELGVK